LSIASASRSFATISSGRCFFRLLVIESLLARRAVDLHIDWIRISKAGHGDLAAAVAGGVGDMVRTNDRSDSVEDSGE
jgi:hypothetical protein